MVSSHLCHSCPEWAEMSAVFSVVEAGWESSYPGSSPRLIPGEEPRVEKCRGSSPSSSLCLSSPLASAIEFELPGRQSRASSLPTSVVQLKERVWSVAFCLLLFGVRGRFFSSSCFPLLFFFSSFLFFLFLFFLVRGPGTKEFGFGRSCWQEPAWWSQWWPLETGNLTGCLLAPARETRSG